MSADSVFWLGARAAWSPRRSADDPNPTVSLSPALVSELIAAQPYHPVTPRRTQPRGLGRHVEVAALGARFADECRSAVDPLEIAAVLEFDGLSDQTAAASYGFSSVFALAEHLYADTPPIPAEPAEPASPWRRGVGRPVLHGLVYGLPAVCFPAGASLLGGRALIVLIASMLSSWSLSQGLAFLGYQRIGQLDEPGGRRVMRAGLLVGVAAVAAVVTVVWFLESSPFAVLAFGVGQGGYMLGASVLMVLGAERRILYALAPGVLTATAFLALGRPEAFEPVLAVGLAATPTIAIAYAVRLTRRSRHDVASREMSAADLRHALPNAAFGLLAAALLAVPLSGLIHSPQVHTGALIAAVPLSLSMGAAEWSLAWYRERTHRLLRTTADLARFHRRARLALLVAVGQYLAAAAVLTAMALGLVAWIGLAHIGLGLLPAIGAYLALGGAMFLALLMQTMGIQLVALGACAVALDLEVAGRGLGGAVLVAASVGLLAYLALHATFALSNAARHAY